MRSLTSYEATILRESVSENDGLIVDYDDHVTAELAVRGLLRVSSDKDWTYFETTPLGRLVLNAFRVLQ